MMMNKFAALAGSLLLGVFSLTKSGAASVNPPGSTPEQVRLALGSVPGEFVVAWTTGGDDTGKVSSVAWGATPSLELGKVAAKSTIFTMNPTYNFTTHSATMNGMKASTRYFYQVTTNGISSATFNWTTPRNSPPYTHLVFGDLGSAYAYTICPDCTSDLTCTCKNRTAGMISEVENADMLLHLGDFAYNFPDQGGLVGDQFMRNIEPLATKAPYMVCVGNHENGDNAIAQYTERFRYMPTASSGSGTISTHNTQNSPNNWFFSWDAGLVHYVAMSTEVQALAMMSYGNGTELVKRQFEWLRADLIKANKNRENVPWVAVFGHRSMYCSCDGVSLFYLIFTKYHYSSF